jgi:hypothetical protein
LFSFLLLFSSCWDVSISEPVYLPGEQEFGWAMGSKSGQQWESSGYWEPYPNDTAIATVIFETFNEAGKPQEAYGLNDIPLIPGTYSIMGSYSDEYTYV